MLGSKRNFTENKLIWIEVNIEQLKNKRLQSQRTVLFRKPQIRVMIIINICFVWIVVCPMIPTHFWAKQMYEHEQKFKFTQKRGYRSFRIDNAYKCMYASCSMPFFIGVCAAAVCYYSWEFNEPNHVTGPSPFVIDTQYKYICFGRFFRYVYKFNRSPKKIEKKK